MSKDIKDLINLAEKEQNSRAHLEKTIEQLNNEINSLHIKLDEKGSSSNASDIEVMKELVNSQRKELDTKISESEILKLRINDLNLEIKNLKQNSNPSEPPELSGDTQEAIHDLMENYAKLEETNIELKQKLSEIENEKSSLTVGVQSKGGAEVLSLKDEIENLEKENQELRNNFIINNTQQLERFELENEIENLIQKNAELEELIEKLKNEGQTLKSERFNQSKLETKISSLNEQIRLLQSENNNLKQNVIGISDYSYRSQSTQRGEELSVIEVNPLEKPDVPKILTPPKKVFNVQPHERNQIPAIEKQAFQAPKVSPKVEKVQSLEKEPTIESLVEKPPADESVEPTERKRKCPECGNISKAQIREVQDKTRPIAYSLYAKKYQCLQCGTEWH